MFFCFFFFPTSRCAVSVGSAVLVGGCGARLVGGGSGGGLVRAGLVGCQMAASPVGWNLLNSPSVTVLVKNSPAETFRYWGAVFCGKEVYFVGGVCYSGG